MKFGRRQSHRPTHKELNGKLKEARDLIRAGKWRPAVAEKLLANFEELEDRFGDPATTFEEQTSLLLRAAVEVTPEDYSGEHPPEPAYESKIKGEDLFAFCWKSPSFGAQMYFKFALKGADIGRRVYPCSIHESRN